MSKLSKKSTKVRIEDPTVPPPWIPFYHTIRKMTFYVNPETNISIWEHPNDYINSDISRENRKRERTEQANGIMALHSEKPSTSTQGRSLNDDEMDMEVDNYEELRQLRVNYIFDISSLNEPGTYNNEEDEEYGERAPKEELRGCAIFDTSALIQCPQLLEIATRNLILTVIPYTVLRELDNLKSRHDNSVLKQSAIITNSILDKLSKSNSYLEMETSDEVKVAVEGFSATNNDEFILKCAYRIKTEFEKVSDGVKRRADSLSHDDIVFVTNDRILAVKARSHQMISMDSKEFVDALNAVGLDTSISEYNQRSSGNNRNLLIERDHLVEEPTLKRSVELNVNISLFITKWSSTVDLLTNRMTSYDEKVRNKSIRDLKLVRDCAMDFLQSWNEKSLSVLIDFVSTIHDFHSNAPVTLGSKSMNKKKLWNLLNNSPAVNKQIVTTTLRDFVNKTVLITK